MAKKDLTQEAPPEEREKTYLQLLEDLMALIMDPLKDFLALVDRDEGDSGRIVRVIAELLKRQDQELDKIYEAIDRTLGSLRLEIVLDGEVVKYEGRIFRDNEIIRAVVDPVKLQAVPKGGA
jgi:hypothetical protein